MIRYTDDELTLHQGDALAEVATMASGSVHSVVTSPPYYGLRDYGSEGQYGLEATTADYVETMRRLFSEIRRVLAPDGTLWLNLGDSYSPGPGTISRTPQTSKNPDGTRSRGDRPSDHRANLTATVTDALPAKNLHGIPWRVALALQADGWILRNAIVWHKPNAMPESITDRLSTRHELLFLLVRSPRYWFDLDPIRVPLAYPEDADGTRTFGGTKDDPNGSRIGASARRTGRKARGTLTWAERKALGSVPGNRGLNTHANPIDSNLATHPEGRNPGDVWSIPTQPFSHAHFAVMPTVLAERCVLAGCRPGGVVLDPFSGSGTTGLAATKHGRRYVGVDLSAEYLDLSIATRLRNASLF